MKVGWSPPCLKGPCRNSPLFILGWTIGPMFPMVKGIVCWQCRVVWAIDLAVSHNGSAGLETDDPHLICSTLLGQHSSRPGQPQPGEADTGETRALAPECRWWLFLVIVESVELQTKVKRRFAKISKSWRRPMDMEKAPMPKLYTVNKHEIWLGCQRKGMGGLVSRVSYSCPTAVLSEVCTVADAFAPPPVAAQTVDASLLLLWTPILNKRNKRTWLTDNIALGPIGPPPPDQKWYLSF